jgi:hypothetical protein
MLKKYFVILILFTYTALAGEENAQQQIEIILFKNNAIDIESDNVLRPINTEAKYKMHSYYEYKYNNLITSALSKLTFVNFELKAYSSAINQTASEDTDIITAADQYISHPLLSNNDKKLNNIKSKILQQKNNEIILHLAWKQPKDHSIEKRYLIDSNILDKTDDINIEYNLVYGTIITKDNNSLDMKFDFILDKDNDKHNFSAAKRIKAGQLNYIDNDNYGMLILLLNI